MVDVRSGEATPEDVTRERADDADQRSDNRNPRSDAATAEFREAQRRILDRYGVRAESRMVELPVLADRAGGRAHVLVTGEGPPVVMVVGGTMAAAMWAPLMAELTGYRLYAVDLPGHGLSAPTTFRTDTMRTTAVDFLVELLDGLGVERAGFVAQSMGGLFACWFALEQPERVTALSLIACPAFLLGTSAPLPMRLVASVAPLRHVLDRLQPPSPKQVERLAAMAGENLDGAPELRDVFVALQRLPGSSENFAQIVRAGVGIGGSRPEVQLNADELAQITQPVQFVWGDHDPFGSPSVGARAAQIIPDAEFNRVPTGHGPWFSEAETVGALVDRFLREHTNAPGPRTDTDRTDIDRRRHTMTTGSKTTPPRTTTTRSAEYRGNPAELYEKHFVPAIGLPFATPVVDAANLEVGEQVLDVACGTGVAARLAAERVGPSGAVTGIDGHPQMLEVARQTVPHSGSSPTAPIEWREASAEGLPFADSSFDAVLCSLSLQFFADKPAAIREMRRVLRPGGRLSIGVPGPTPPMFEVLHDVLADHLGAEAAGFVHAVFSLHEPDRLRELLSHAELTGTEVHQSSIPLRLDEPADFFWQYMLSTPLAVAVADLDERDRVTLERDVVTRWQPFVTERRLVTDVGFILATPTAP